MRGGPPLALVLDPSLAGRRMPPEITTTVHRVVQESLTNVRKHTAGAGRVEVSVRMHPGPEVRLQVSVTDDGPGGTATARDKAHGHGYGLVGLTERVEETGGRIAAGPHSDGGCRVLAVVPLDTDSCA